MTEVVITVYGTPAPQGSKRAFAVRGKGGAPTGRVAVIESSHDRVKSWRQAVVDAALDPSRRPAARHAARRGRQDRVHVGRPVRHLQQPHPRRPPHRPAAQRQAGARAVHRPRHLAPGGP
jgi:hypothetical protein